MAYLNIPDALTSAEVQFRKMYRYFLEKGIDISVPYSVKDLSDLCNQYVCETGNIMNNWKFFAEKSPSMLVASEANTFSLRKDVSITKHHRYCPVPIHSHEYFEIMCIAKGSCTIYIGNVSVRMQTGDAMIVPPYVAHTISVFNDECILYNEEIRFSTLRNKFSNLFSSKHVISELFIRSFDPNSDPCYLIFHTGDYFLGDNKFGDIVAEFNSESEYSFEVLNILTSAFLFDLLRSFSETAMITTINAKSKIDVLLTEYITEHADTVTLAELSRRFSYSDRQIARIIRKNTGLAYSQLVRKIKMEAIAKMVAGSNLSIEKIIEISGASSPSYFYKTFKSYFGKTPLEYRSCNAASYNS